MLNINLIEKLSVKLGFKNKATTVSITDSNNTTVSGVNASDGAQVKIKGIDDGDISDIDAK